MEAVEAPLQPSSRPSGIALPFAATERGHRETKTGYGIFHVDDPDCVRPGHHSPMPHTPELSIFVRNTGVIDTNVTAVFVDGKSYPYRVYPDPNALRDELGPLK